MRWKMGHVMMGTRLGQHFEAASSITFDSIVLVKHRPAAIRHCRMVLVAVKDVAAFGRSLQPIKRCAKVFDDAATSFMNTAPCCGAAGCHSTWHP